MKIAVMDDSHGLNDSIRNYLIEHGHEAMSAYDGEQGVELCRAQPVDVAIVDIFMPLKDGLEVIMDIKKQNPKIKIIAISGVHGTDEDYLSTAKIFGADLTIKKPFSMQQLLDDVQYLVEN